MCIGTFSPGRVKQKRGKVRLALNTHIHLASCSLQLLLHTHTHAHAHSDTHLYTHSYTRGKRVRGRKRKKEKERERERERENYARTRSYPDRINQAAAARFAFFLGRIARRFEIYNSRGCVRGRKSLTCAFTFKRNNESAACTHCVVFHCPSPAAREAPCAFPKLNAWRKTIMPPPRVHSIIIRVFNNMYDIIRDYNPWITAHNFPL